MRRDAATAAGQHLTGEEPFMYFMGIHYPESNLKILDYNRVLKALNGMTNEDFLAKLSESYDVTPYEGADLPKPQIKGESSLYLGHKWYKLRVKEEKIDKSNLVKQLDSQ